MKKIMAIIALIIIMTGCTVVRIDTNDIDNTINVVLSKNNELYNKVGKGYKYYIPRGVSYIDTTEYNDKLYSNGIYYYLYIDTISFYYNSDFNCTINNEIYYSKCIDINNKKGYLQITKNEDEYYIEFMYNYAKIEALVSSNNIEEVILNSSYILSTIKFNNNVIKTMLDNEFLQKEEKYDIFSPKYISDDFLKLEEEEN